MLGTTPSRAKRGASPQVEDWLGGGHVDVGPATGEGDATLPDHERVDDRVRAIERVDPAVGQEHGTMVDSVRRGVKRA